VFVGEAGNQLGGFEGEYSELGGELWHAFAEMES
jgi:hypothetical protein